MSEVLKATKAIPIPLVTACEVVARSAMEELVETIRQRGAAAGPDHVVGYAAACDVANLRIAIYDGSIRTAAAMAMAEAGLRPSEGWRFMTANLDSLIFEAEDGTEGYRKATSAEEPEPVGDLPAVPADEWLPNGNVIMYRRKGEPLPQAHPMLRDLPKAGYSIRSDWSKEFQAMRHVVRPAGGHVIPRPPEADGDGDDDSHSVGRLIGGSMLFPPTAPEEAEEDPEPDPLP